MDRFLEARAAVDLRYVDEPPYGRFGEPREPHSQVWFRTNGKLADDPCCTSSSPRTSPT
ncbi:hypothetical protein SHKM778_81220 [Streptomyces sp. KM77-8]|uniref:Uncharacterized protein n=1 Tax=Streptomyces haneummycinicus TaxID=3074435 RepID=A0AAT9HWH9_9ACTN